MSTASPGRRCGRGIVALAGLWLCVSGAAQAEQRGRTSGVRVAQGPEIEGSLSDPLWEKAPPLSLYPAPGMGGKLKTTVRLLFGDSRLYAAIECEEPDPRLLAKARERDSNVWEEDSVELFILPHPEVGYKHIAINPLGTIFDQAVAPGGKGDRGWNADVKVAVSAQAGRNWKVALSISYKDLGAYAGHDQTWRFNATRTRKARGDEPLQEYTWSELPRAEFQLPDAFGVIEHVEVPGPASGTARRLPELHAGLEWTRRAEIAGVRRLFPHPFAPHVVWCATAAGLLATDDDGQTWKPVETAGADAVGEVTCLAVSTRDPETICMGTEARGLFLSTDGGKTWKPLGGRAERYASDHIEWVDFCPSDPSRRTLLATHGLAAPGFSMSRDLGATWEVSAHDRFLARFVKRGETIIAAGSMSESEGKVWGIHRSGTDGFHWEETIRNIRPTVPVAPGARWQFLAATLDGAILQSFDDGKSWSELVRSEGSAWASLFFTNGATDSGPVLAAYDPRRQGLCLSRHRFANGLGERENQGLYVGPYVKSGAGCVANANGTVYYAALNNALWTGRRAALGRTGPAVVQARCRPCAVWVDRAALLDDPHDGAAAGPPAGNHAPAAHVPEERKDGIKLTVLAQVRGPGDRPLRADQLRVTVDLAELGGGPQPEPLYDDGNHDDEKAADGIYGTTVIVPPALLRQPDFRETRLLTVTARDAGGAGDSCVAVVHIGLGPAPAVLLCPGRDEVVEEGQVSVRVVGDQGLRPKTSALEFRASGNGPWRGAWLMPGDGVNSAGCKWFTFVIRGDVDQELFVYLMDHHRIGEEGLFDKPHFSKPVALIAGGYLKAITPAYQKVRVPIAELLPRGLYFLRWHTAGIGVSVGEKGKPGAYHIDLVQIEP